MKKVIYVVVVLVILLVLSMLLKDNATSTNEVAAPVPATVEADAEQAVEDATPSEVAPLEEGAVVVDVEPASKTTDAETPATDTTAETPAGDATAEAPAADTAETVVEDVVEENPSATADEGETVVE